MPTVTKSLRLPKETAEEIEQTARRVGRNFSSVANELLDEALKMRRYPGVVFTDGATGRRARLAGTGIEVWEVIATYQSVNQSWKRLKAAYHWLDEAKLRAALTYYECYPEEIEERIQQNESWTPERLKQSHPFTRQHKS